MDVIHIRRTYLPAVLFMTVLACGCHGLDAQIDARRAPIIPASVPRELEKVSLPDYRVEPPDILLLESVRAIPKPPYKIEPLDVLFVQLADPLPDRPLSGLVSVEPDGTINLGIDYGGAVQVRGLTLAEAQAVIEKHITDTVKIAKPRVSVSLSQSRAAQRISGPHLVRPDGTISLGTYGSVRVVGLTLPEIRRAVEAQLSAYLVDPEVSVDVQGYNSKLYYVIMDGAGAGQTVHRLPVTGNDTVLDAISQITGLSAVSSTDRIWVSRPAPAGCQHQILPVDWRAVTECGDPATNYQLLPGDRIFVAAIPMARIDTRLARTLAPIERLFGITLLGSGTVNSIRNSGVGGGGGGFGGF
jgi:polysaccharide export outer membrane protein